MDQDLKIYMISIKQYKRLTNEECIEYIKRYQNGEDLLNDIFNANLALVIKVAKKYFSYANTTSLTYMDIVQYGNLGLIKAIQTFDIEKSKNFSTWAYTLIDFEIKASIRKYGNFMYVNYKSEQDISEYQRVYQELQEKYDREPTIEELLLHLKMTKKRILHIQEVLLIMQLHSLITYDKAEYTNMIEYKVNEQNVEDAVDIENIHNEETRAYLLKFLEKVGLTDRQKEAFILKYREGKTFSEIANILGINASRAFQLSKIAIEKVRKSPYIFELALYTDDPSYNLKLLGYSTQEIEDGLEKIRKI